MHAIPSPPHRALLAAAALTFLLLMLVLASSADLAAIDFGGGAVDAGLAPAEPTGVDDAGEAAGMQLTGEMAGTAFDNSLPSAGELLGIRP